LYVHSQEVSTNPDQEDDIMVMTDSRRHLHNKECIPNPIQRKLLQIEFIPHLGS
jgi:hypothetical protein